MLNQQKLRSTLEKCEALANDKQAPIGEREAAKAQAEKIREKLKSSVGDDAEYKKLVQQGRTAAKKQDDAGWELGELASKVEGVYGEGKLEQYSLNIGIALDTLIHYRRAYLAFEKLPRGSFSIGAAKALAAIKDETARYKIVKDNPTISARAAEGKVRDWKEKQRQEKESKKKKSTAKSKSSGKEKPEPETKKKDIYAISGGTKSLIEIFDSMLAKGGNVQERVKELKVEEEERKLLLGALWSLRDRVDALIKKYSPKDKE